MTPPTFCNYNRVGEINGDLRRMVKTQFGDNTLFSVHSDDAPTVYVNGTAAQPIRDQTDPVVREPRAGDGRARLARTRTPAWSRTTIMVGLADHDGDEHAPHGHDGSVPDADVHAVRGSGLVLLRNGRGDSHRMRHARRVRIDPGADEPELRWNNGDIQDEIASTWIGMVGPGVEPSATPDETWMDHTDLRPTILSLLGLKDDYTHDGRC